MDIDQDNIAWCQANLGNATFLPVPLYPPTEIPDGSFDLVYGISVFTHLTRAAFPAWIDELHRIVRPGGIVLVTVHSGAALIRQADEEFILKTLRDGFNDEAFDSALNQHVSDQSYYRGTFVTTAEAKRLFGRRFIVRDILPQASATQQDLVGRAGGRYERELSATVFTDHGAQLDLQVSVNRSDMASSDLG